MPKKDKGLIESTIEAYLSAGATLYRQGKWDAGYLRFRRALHFATKPSPILAGKIKAAFDDFLAHTASQAPLIEVTLMMQAYRDHINGDPNQLAAFASIYADKARDEKLWHLRRQLLTLKASWLRVQNRESDVRAALYEAAETHFALAEEALQRASPSHLLAAEHLMRAAKAHRELDKKSQRAIDLDRLRAEYQKKGIQETKWVNLTEEPGGEALKAIIETAENQLRAAAIEAARVAQGLPFYEALRLLALCHPPPDKGKQEALAIEELRNSVWSALLPITLYDEDGRPFAKAGSFLHSNADGQRNVIEQRMLKWFKNYHIPETVAIFEAVREQLNEEFNILPELIEPVIAHSPFIPEGRGYFFARGLYAGLIGDFPLASSFLAPQLEDAIRVHLAAHNVIPTVTEKSETERPADLNYLFKHKRNEIEAIFGIDETFELEALLIRRWGCHLRNYIAHGQLSIWQFYEPPVRYLWWIALRFCMFGSSPIPKPDRSVSAVDSN